MAAEGGAAVAGESSAAAPAAMEQGLTHRTVPTNGIYMHFVEMGSGPVVLFVHGFPEGWYGWRKQISAFAKAGYRAVAPDLRGYGDTSAPQGVEKYTVLHIVGDLIGLLDALQVEKVLLVGHDWGAIISWQLALFRPDRIIAFACLSVYFFPWNPAGSFLQLMRAAHGEEFYMCRLQLPGKFESTIREMTPEVMFTSAFATTRRYHSQQSKPAVLPTANSKIPLPEWVTEEDLAYYVAEFNKHGYTPAINYYRAIDLSWELTAPWKGSKVMVPTIFMIGDQDMVYHFHGAKEYIQKGHAVDVPLLKETIILEGVKHFLQLEKPDTVNHHILKFFKDFKIQ